LILWDHGLQKSMTTTTKLETKQRVWPWIEGLLLALLVLGAVTMGGESARVSYHGYLHTTIGEAVLNEGLLPENPYHAGEALNYYTLYPTLGVLIGRLGVGALWGFAIMNIIAALLMGPALDALAKRLQFKFAARRAAFWCMLLGFNLFGYYLAYGVNVPPPGAMPFAILEPMTNIGDMFSWDARLQSFVAKFLNVSSFACSLPLMLFAVSNAIENTKQSRLLSAILLGLCIAINPLVGAFSALLVVGQALLCSSNDIVQELFSWAKLGSLSAIIALPFLLPLFINANSIAAAEKELPFIGDGAIFNLIGPCLLLILMCCFAVRLLSKTQSKVILLAAALAIAFSFASLPFSNEYKFPRLFAIFLAIPAGQFVVSYSKHGFAKIGFVLLALIAVPTTYATLQAYAHWDISKSLPLVTAPGGVLTPRVIDEQTVPAIPLQVLDAIRNLPSGAVLMMHPRFPGVASMAQGNQWAPALQHTLFVDRPQIHNRPHHQEALHRLSLCVNFWGANEWPALPALNVYAPLSALAEARQIVAGRQLAILSTASSVASHDYLQGLNDSGDVDLVAHQGDVYLWLFSAVQKVDEN